MKVKLVAYKTLCRPLVEYASEAWDPYTKKLIEHLELFQNKAMCFVLNLKGICNMTEARENLGLETLSDRCKPASISLLMKIIADDTESSAVITRMTIIPVCLSHLCLLLYKLIYNFLITALFRGRLGTRDLALFNYPFFFQKVPSSSL